MTDQACVVAAGHDAPNLTAPRPADVPHLRGCRLAPDHLGECRRGAEVPCTQGCILDPDHDGPCRFPCLRGCSLAPDHEGGCRPVGASARRPAGPCHTVYQGPAWADRVDFNDGSMITWERDATTVVEAAPEALDGAPWPVRLWLAHNVSHRLGGQEAGLPRVAGSVVDGRAEMIVGGDEEDEGPRVNVNVKPTDGDAPFGVTFTVKGAYQLREALSELLSAYEASQSTP